MTRQTKSLCKSATICKSRFSPERDQSLASRTSAVSPPRFVRLAASRSRTMPVSLPIVQLLLFFVYPFFFGQRIRLFPREHVEFPCKARAQRGVRRGRDLSDCRHLSVGLSLINDGNIPPYTVTRPRPARDTTLSVVYKRYCRCTATLRSFPTRFCSINHSCRQETHHHCKISADLRFSTKSFFARQV